VPDDLSEPSDQDAAAVAGASARPRPAPAAVPRRKAPAKPAESIAHRIHDLEERLSAGPGAPEAEPAPTKLVPAKRVAKAPRKAPAEAPAEASATAAAKAPAKVRKVVPASAAVVAAAAPTQAAVEPEQAITEAISTAALDAAPVPAKAPARASKTLASVATSTPRESAAPQPEVAGLKAIVTVIVLLLATAAGLGAAAVVASRPATWEARSVVALLPAETPTVASDAFGDGVKRYREKVGSTSFTALAALEAGLEDAQVRENIRALPGRRGEMVVVARTVTADASLKLANAAAAQLVLAIVDDQAKVALTSGDRLGATVKNLAPSTTRVTPTDSQAALAGLLAGGAVLLIAGVLALLARPRES
jgi:hypothetical protein